MEEKQEAKKAQKKRTTELPPRDDSAPDSNAARPYDWKRCEFPVEVKRASRLDAFTDSNTTTIESSAELARSNRGQLISYMKEQMSRQHRTSLHELFIFGDYARLLFFDRSGGVVTKKFNYHEQPELLAKFLWRYNHMDAVARGWDPSVVLATDEESRTFDERVGTFLTKCERASEVNGFSYEPFAGTLAADYPTYKIELDSPKYSGTLIIRRPFFEPSSPVGRATRGYVAYDWKREEIVFLKDTWRTEHRSERMSEPEVYNFLESKVVPNIPEVLYAADIRLPDGSQQRTVLNRFTTSSEIRRYGPLRGHTHCRIVQRLAFPLESFRDSKELVRILRDALLGKPFIPTADFYI